MMIHCFEKRQINRDKEKTLNTTMTKTSILVQKPPNCPQCNGGPNEEGSTDMDESQNIPPPPPSYDEEAAKIAMEEINRLVTRTAKNQISEDEDYEAKINKSGWNQIQMKLFSRIVKILDSDRLARFAYQDKPHEAIQRRTLIDKSTDRFRRALATVHWDTLTIQWLHGVLMDYLPGSYLAAYLDIMQALKARLPSIVDKMIFWKPGTCNQELLAPILKKPWQPLVTNKNRKLPGQPLIVVVPSSPKLSEVPSRQKKLYSLFSTMASVLPIQYPNSLNAAVAQKQHLQAIVEQLISATRTKIQDLRGENPERPLILVGFNSGAALALQVALVEQVSGVVCFGFAYNTVHGCRGAPDDLILDLTTPTLFLIGQNSARTSQEEIECLQEKMIAHTSLVTIGSADDCLRVSKTKRKIEGVTQEMIDNMIIDEIADFATMCLTNPPPPKTQNKTTINSSPVANGPIIISDSALVPAPVTILAKKRKLSQSSESDPVSAKISLKSSVKIPKTHLTPSQLKSQPTPEVLDMAIQSILPDNEPPKLTNVYDISATSVKPKQMPIHTNQGQFRSLKTIEKKSMVGNQNLKFVQVKPPQQQHKLYTLKSQQATQAVRRPNIVQISPANSRPTSPRKIINIKNTSFLSSSESSLSLSSSSNFSPKKFTILKTPSSTPNTTFGDVDSPDLSNTSIMDIPIVFADSDGNINEDSTLESSFGSQTQESPSGIIIKPVTSTSTTTATSISNPTVIKGKNLVINKNGKLVFINKASIIKPGPGNMNLTISKNQPQKFQKIVMTSAKPVSEANQSPQTRIITIPSTSKTSTIGGVAKKIEILNNTLIKPASGNIPLNFQSVRINMDGTPISSSSIVERTQNVRSIVKLSDSKTITSFTPVTSTIIQSNAPKPFVINSSTLKPFSGTTKINPATLNRQNITVKKINIVQSPQITKDPQNKPIYFKGKE